MSARRSMSLAPLRLLGRHVRELALELPGARRRQLARRARDAEVRQARAAVDADEDVLRRDVAVHDAERVVVVVLELVGGVEPREHVDDDAQAHLRRKAQARLRGAREQATERVALHVLHDDVVALVARANLEDGNDVRVVDARGEARLLQEHLDELGLARQVRVQALDGGEALEAADAREAREVHRGHAARRELGHELEAIELLALSFDCDELAQRGVALGRLMGPVDVSILRAGALRAAVPGRGCRLRMSPAAPLRPGPARASTCSPACGAALPGPRRVGPLREEDAETAVTSGDPAVAAISTFVRVCELSPCWYCGQLLPWPTQSAFTAAVPGLFWVSMPDQMVTPAPTAVSPAPTRKTAGPKRLGRGRRGRSRCHMLRLLRRRRRRRRA